MSTLPALVCLGAVAWLLGVEHALARLPQDARAPGLQAQRALSKLLASSAFIAQALMLGAMSTAYGRWVLVALAFSWLGDALLLSARQAAFLAGMGAFALAHAGFAVAFALGGLDITALAVAALAMAGIGALTLRWLRPHLPAGMAAPLTGYVVIIGVMVALASGHGAAMGHWLVPLGAALFAASDLAVARQQFVRRAWRNPAIGLPLYFGAQMLLASSVAAPA